MCYFKMQNLSPHLKKVRYVFSAVGFHSDTICRQEAFVFIRGTIMQVWKKAFRAPATFHCRFHYVLPLRITPDSSKSAREPRKKDLKQGPFFSTIYPFSYFAHLHTSFWITVFYAWLVSCNFYFIKNIGLYVYIYKTILQNQWPQWVIICSIK